MFRCGGQHGRLRLWAKDRPEDSTNEVLGGLLQHRQPICFRLPSSPYEKKSTRNVSCNIPAFLPSSCPRAKPTRRINHIFSATKQRDTSAAGHSKSGCGVSGRPSKGRKFVNTWHTCGQTTKTKSHPNQENGQNITPPTPHAGPFCQILQLRQQLARWCLLKRAKITAQIPQVVLPRPNWQNKKKNNFKNLDHMIHEPNLADGTEHERRAQRRRQLNG